MKLKDGGLKLGLLNKRLVVLLSLRHVLGWVELELRVRNIELLGWNLQLKVTCRRLRNGVILCL